MADLEDIRKRARALEQQSFTELWTLVVETSSVLCEIDPPRRKAWLVEVIQEMKVVQGGLCALCNRPFGEEVVEVDHVIPFCYGGGNERANIQIAHRSCNRSKRNSVDPHDLLRYLEDRYMNL